MTLTREQILAANDSRRELVEVPEWGGSVYVSVMSGAARDAWEAGLITRDGTPVLTDVSAKLAAATITDEAGERLFSEADVAELTKRSAAALKRVIDVARRLNGLGVAGIEDAKGN